MPIDVEIDVEKEQEFKSPVHAMMRGSYFYRYTSVNKSRKVKCCALCSTKIPVGSALKGAKLYNYGIYQVDFCKQCEEKYKVELDLMGNGDLDEIFKIN